MDISNTSLFGRLKQKLAGLNNSARLLLAVFTILLLIAIFWVVDRLFLYFFAKHYIEQIAYVYNLDANLSYALTLIVWVVALFFISKLFSLSKSQRLLGFMGVLSLIIFHSWMLSSGTRDQLFGPNGEALKCFVLSRNGEFRLLEHPGVDPVTGRECRPYTIDMAERLKTYATGKLPTRITGYMPEFYEARFGQPIVWYWKAKDGSIELFDLMGFHPISGEELQPVNAEIIAAYKQQFATEVRLAQRKLRPAKRITNIEEHELFDPATGEPLVWYWRGPNAEYEFFDNEGFHPGNGQRLKPFTSEAITKWREEKALEEAYKKQEEDDRIKREQLKRDAEERRIEQEHAAQERQQRAEDERQQLAKEAADRCDQLAGNPHDPQRNSSVMGVRFGELKQNSAAATAACQKARSLFPSELRFAYQYARAVGFSKPDEAISIYRRLIQQKYVAAFDNLGSLLVQKNDQKSIMTAIQVFKDGARNGDPDSMVSLASWADSTYLPVTNPFAYKLTLLREAARLGNEDAKDAADELESQAQQQQQEYATQRQQEQMMLNLFGHIVGGVIRGR